MKTILLLALLFLFSCSINTPDEKLIKTVLTDMQNEDTLSLKKYWITPSDFTVKKQGLSPMKAKQGFVGGVLCKQEQAALIESFLDWSEEINGATFVSATKVESGSMTGLMQSNVSYTGYEITVQKKQSEVLPFYIVLTQWQNKPRLLYIVPKEEEE